MKQAIGNVLRRYRDTRGATQTEVAKAIGISQATYSQWENGDYLPKIPQIMKLAAYFHCRPSDLDYRLEQDYAEIQLENHQINQEHYGADVSSEHQELRVIDDELEKLKNKTLDEHEEHYKHSLEEDAAKIRARIEAKIRAARRERENPAPLPANIPPFPGKSAPDTIRNTPELRECIKDAMLREGVRDASELNRRIGYDSSHSLERLLNGKLPWFPDVLSAVLDGLNIKQDDAPYPQRNADCWLRRGSTITAQS